MKWKLCEYIVFWSKRLEPEAIKNLKNQQFANYNVVFTKYEMKKKILFENMYYQTGRVVDQ